MKVGIGQCKVRKAERWYVSRLENGKRRRTFYTSQGAAEAEASRFRSEAAAVGNAWASLSSADRDRVMQVYLEAKRRGVDLFKALEAAPTVEGPALSVVIKELTTAKTTAGRAQGYVDNLDLLLGQFATGREAMPVSAVSLSDVEKWLDSKPAASRATLRARLSTLFRFAIRRGYRPDNPCARLESVTMPHKPPAIFTLAQTLKALQWLATERPQAMPWFILSCLAGLRPEEAQQTTRKDISAKEGWIRVEAQTSKVRQRRVVYPRPEAMKLLKRSLKKGRLPLSPESKRRAMRALRDHLGLSVWPKDITRHTAASYWLAVSRSAKDVAESLGNSETILRKHYMAIVTQAQAEKFWAAIAEFRTA